jgi:replicative DNA helicase
MDVLDELDLQSDAAERALIGAVAFHPDALAGVLAQLPGADFFNPARGIVWDACRALSDERQVINPVTVSRWLAEHDQWLPAAQAVVQVGMNDAHPARHAEQNARIVADLARRREYVRAIKHAYQIVRDHTEILADVRAVFDDLGPGAEQQLGGTLTWPQLLEEFETAHHPDTQHDSIPTPWPALDDCIGGLFGGRLYVIGGQPGDGKSATALNIAAHAAECGRSVLVFSKEMPTVDVTGRLVARGAEISLARINGRQLSDFDRARYRKFREHTARYKLRVNADPVSVTGVKQMARALRHRGHLDLLVVDYLQLLNVDKAGRSAEEEIGRISKDLKHLSMELDVPVVVPAQLNRNPSARADGRPNKSDLRSSGQIEQDADVVILLWRQPVVVDEFTKAIGPDPHNLTLIIDKNRHGPKAEFQLRWNGGYGQVG